MTNTEQLIYLAGFVDGEGCLTANQDRCYFRPRLTISSTNKIILCWVKLLFGGNIYEHHRKNAALKVNYEWQIFCNQAIGLVKCLFPYLKVKKDEAKVFLKFEDADKTTQKELSLKLSKMKHNTR